MESTTLKRLSDEYDQAESVFLDALRSEAARGDVASAARAVAEAASQFNVEAYRVLHAGMEGAWMPLDLLTERTELLAELWSDLAAAYET